MKPLTIFILSQSFEAETVPELPVEVECILIPGIDTTDMKFSLELL